MLEGIGGRLLRVRGRRAGMGPGSPSGPAGRDARARRPLLTWTYLAKSFRPLRGRTLTTRRAGLALNTCSSLVNGLMPLRALVAGLLTTTIFISPGTVNVPGPFLPT